ncbi:MAG: BLUF domain-containing protein [Wenzhouxiangella sp.]|nr:MAG: BLUF domain-containing protein [Wenzhouxiangella sp.]
MGELVQLIYASRSRLDLRANSIGLAPEIGVILNQSRRNNKPLAIGGVLCFGDGNFFQCLEGERETVEALYEQIKADDRHHDVVLLRKEPVHHRQYRLWAMKFLGVDQFIRKFLAEQGLERFDPFKLDDAGIDRLLEMLRRETEPGSSEHPGSRPHEVNRLAASGGISPAMLGAGALGTALVVVALIVLVIL